jgi:hypothetical protein
VPPANRPAVNSRPAMGVTIEALSPTLSPRHDRFLQTEGLSLGQWRP